MGGIERKRKTCEQKTCAAAEWFPQSTCTENLYEKLVKEGKGGF